MHISMAFLNEGDKSWSQIPISNLCAAVKLSGGIPVYYDLKPELHWRLDLEFTRHHSVQNEIKMMLDQLIHISYGPIC
jgi:aspartate/methionine/tyrosine aminotransferase